MLPRLAAVTAIMVALLGPAPAFGLVSVIRDDPGGLIYRYHLRYAEWGMYWQIDGECSSACTMVLGTGRVCATPRARLGFHAGTALGRINRGATMEMYRTYPPAIKRWVDRHRAMRSLRLTFMRQPEIARYVPTCAA